MDNLTERNSSLLRRAAEAEGANAVVKGQLQEFHQKLRLTQVDNNLLHQQIAFLQKQQKVSTLVGCKSRKLLGVRHTCLSSLPFWHLSNCIILDFSKTDKLNWDTHCMNPLTAVSVLTFSSAIQLHHFSVSVLACPALLAFLL